MYYLLGIKNNLEAIATVTRDFVEKDLEIASFSDYKKAYIEFCRRIQPEIPESNGSDGICFVEDGDLSGQLIKIFLDSNLNADKETISGFPFEKIQDNEVLQNKYNLVKDAIKRIQEHTPEFYFIFEMLFSYIFLIKSNNIACATIPKAMGLLLLDHRNWEIVDLCEMIVHETTHQLVTLDEYRYGYYNDIAGLTKPDNFAISAMRATKRPIHKVIHSLVVAYEIVAYRKAAINPDATVNVRAMIESCV